MLLLWGNACCTAGGDAGGRSGFQWPVCPKRAKSCFPFSSCGTRMSFFLFRPGESRNHFPQWQRQGFAYATNAKDFFPACCIWTQTEDDFLWLCSCWTNYTAFLPDVAAQGVFGLQSSVMAAVCNGDLNTLKCQGGRDARFWSVIFCAENPIELS